MQVGILGCGWIGIKLANALLSQGHSVYTSNTSKDKAQAMEAMGCNAYVIDFLDKKISESITEQFKVLDFILISVSVSRNADQEQQENIFKKVVDFLNDYQGKITLLSTTGIYPQEDKVITEKSYPQEQLHPKINSVEQIVSKGLPQTNILRLGGLLGGDRLMTNWIKDINQLSQPNHPVNHVHYEDVIGIIQKLMTSEISGQIFNVVAPEHPTKKEVFLGKPDSNTIEGQYRIIDGSKLQQTLSYTYIHPNPINFS